MISVNLSESDMYSYLENNVTEEHRGKITVACINSPKNVTISGDEPLLDSIQALLERSQITARKLKTGLAYHSPHMQEIALQYSSSIQGLEKGNPIAQDVTMISSVTGERLLTTNILTSVEYWVKNMVEPVQFSRAVVQMASKTKSSSTRKLGATTQGVIYNLVEIGPHSTLKHPITETLEANSLKAVIAYHYVLSRYSPSIGDTLKLAGHLYSIGYPVALNEVNQIQPHSPTKESTLADLPEYPFNHSRKY
jgi:acyl transferase domain-containing protein